MGFLHNTQALLRIFAPLSAAKIYFWIKYNPPALSALKLRLVLEELYLTVAAGALHFKNIVGLPKSLVLSRTSDHIPVLICAPIFFNQFE
jgi:hypothetical protein